jgi:ribosomal protein L37AE/L43A
MFKERTVKKRVVTPDGCISNTATLDARHKKVIADLTKEHSKLDDMMRDKTTIENDIVKQTAKIESMKSHSRAECVEYDAAWSKLMKLKDNLRATAERLNKIKLCEAEIDYYSNTGDILFKYYEIIDKQESMGACVPADIPKLPVLKPKKKSIPTGTRSVLESLGVFTVAEALGDGDCGDGENAVEKDSVDDRAPKVSSVNKGELIDMYLAAVDPVHIKTVSVAANGEANVEICSMCNEQMVCMYHEGIMYCSKCGYQELLLVEQNKPVYRQPTKDASHLSYKRINHFNEWILQCQGKESTDIPDEIFDKILLEIKKDKISDTSKITYNKMREYLKKLKVNRFYEHIPYIISRINGVPTPHFSADLEEKLRSMFKEIQAPFLRHRPQKRKNFLSYSFCIYKMLQLLEKDEYLKHFPLLKSREKLHLQDQIWFKICADLKWTALPSM